MIKPGGGKTAAALTGSEKLPTKPGRALIVAPLKVVENDVWPREAALWEHLAHLTFTTLRGTPKKRRALLAGSAPDFWVINYELLSWLVEELDGLPFSKVIWDEVSFLKAPGTVRFRKIRRHLPKIPYRIGLTGTPTGNNLINLFGECFAVADSKPLGNSYVEYKHRYFRAVDPDQFVWVPKDPLKKTHAAIMERIKPWALSIKVPKTTAPTFAQKLLKLPRVAAKFYSDIVVRLHMTTPSGVKVLALNDLAQTGKLQQICSGAMYTAPPTQDEPHPPFDVLHTAKIDALRELIEEMEGQPLLLFYQFRHEVDRIRALLDSMGISRHQWRMGAAKENVDAWNERRLRVFVMHPKSGGHGLNLQHGGSDMCFFTTPWSLELYQQCVGRLDRPGQKDQVVVHSLVLDGTLDQEVDATLARNEQIEQMTFEATA